VAKGMSGFFGQQKKVSHPKRIALYAMPVNTVWCFCCSIYSFEAAQFLNLTPCATGVDFAQKFY
jgi:hypothetical protein